MHLSITQFAERSLMRTVHVFEQKFSLKDAIEFHAFAPREAHAKRVTKIIPHGRPLPLTVRTFYDVTPLKVLVSIHHTHCSWLTMNSVTRR
jgi:hypothetical protein